MTARFDPWAALAVIRAEAAISGISGFSRGCPRQAETAPDPPEVIAARVAFYLAFMAEAAAALAEREPDPIEEAERAAVFGGGGEAQPHPPCEPDPLREGLLRGWQAHRRNASPEKT